MGASSYSACPRLPKLPKDLIIQILLRMPVKSLLRFKLVSKKWYNFLKTPYFISMHHKFNASQLLMCSHHWPRVEDGDIHVFSFYSNDKSVRMLSPELQIMADPDTLVYLLPGSCNGIVCYYDRWSSIFLSNPATREFKRLPPTSFQHLINQQWYQSGVAFGFDSANIYDFKVLRLFCALTNDGMFEPSNKGVRAEMFTSSSNTWKQLHWGLDNSVLFLRSDGFFCANSFHFLVKSESNTAQENIIVCCDISTERFKTMELPLVGNRPRACRLIMVLKEFLSAVVEDYKEKSLEIWIMKDYGVVESWTKLYKIGPPWGHSIPECFWMEDDALLLLELKTYKLASWNLNTLHGEDVKIDGYNAHAQLVVYKETLLSIM